MSSWLHPHTASLDIKPLNVTIDTSLDRDFLLLEVTGGGPLSQATYGAWQPR